MAASIFTANTSGVLIDNQPLEGIRSIDYRVVREVGNVHALGGTERIATYQGPSVVEGQIRVASVNAKLDGLAASGAVFQVVANLKQGQASRSISFDECYVVDKQFSMESGRYGETLYRFTATRVREEDAAKAQG
jgi:hypothetical protein